MCARVSVCVCVRCGGLCVCLDDYRERACVCACVRCGGLRREETH